MIINMNKNSKHYEKLYKHANFGEKKINEILLATFFGLAGSFKIHIKVTKREKTKTDFFLNSICN